MKSSCRLIMILFISVFIYSSSWSQQWYDQYKIYDTHARKTITIAELVDSASDVNVLLFGEEHNDSIAHRLQDTLYRSLLDRYRNLALSTEMFERDCQQVLDEYLQGFITDDRLVKEGRAWSNYKDYRPVVNTAKQWHQPVIAANAPRRYVNMVSRKGLGSLDSLPKASKAYFAKLPIDTVNEAYYKKFSEAMGGDHMGRNVYYAQTLWDATMAESIYRYWKKNRSTKILHLNGRFHTDYHLGTFTQLQRKHNKWRISSISCFAAADFASPSWDGYAQLADYVIVTNPEVPKSFQ